MTVASSTSLETQRLDKWLWCARFYKTRSLAAQEIGKGRISVNDQVTKAARELRLGERITLRQPGGVQRTVLVRGFLSYRGPAPVAQQLYEETPESLALREQAAQARRLAPEPAHDLRQGRPTKRQRRELEQWRSDSALDTRWSAALK